MARAEAVVTAAAGEDEEAAAPLVSSGAGARRAGASATRDAHLLSAAFLFVFLAYHAAQNLQSTVNTDENLGSVSLGVLYTSFTAFAVVGSPVVRRMGSRLALVVGTSGYLLFIAANLAPSWYAHTRHLLLPCNRRQQQQLQLQLQLCWMSGCSSLPPPGINLGYLNAHTVVCSSQ
ncbi:hypothetical protein ACP4OV_023217 [Aristida adscensionis]